MSWNIVAAVMALTVVLVQPVVVSAGEIKVWTARAIATVLAEIGSAFERETGHKLIISSDLPPAFTRRVKAGEALDILISGSSPVDEWIRDGRIVAQTRTDIARSGIGVEVTCWTGSGLRKRSGRRLLPASAHTQKSLRRRDN